MARITNYEESKSYESSSGFEIFNLEDDGDSDKVQFIADSLDDLLIYTTHLIPMKSKTGKDYERKVGCLKTHASDPQGTCPLCDSGSKVKLARFIPMYSHSQGKIVLWERSGQFIEKNIGSTFARIKNTYGKNPSQMVVEVVRSGKKGDQKTTYAFYPLENAALVDTSTMEIPDPEGSLIATWSAGDMHNYIANGVVPQNNSSNDANVTRRDRTATQPAAPQGYADQGGFVPPPAQAPAGVSFDANPVSDPTSVF